MAKVHRALSSLELQIKTSIKSIITTLVTVGLEKSKYFFSCISTTQQQYLYGNAEIELYASIISGHVTIVQSV